MPLVLLVSYSGAFGGAERLLVEFASALPGEVCLACPPGRLADAARAAGLRVFELRARTLRLRGGIRARAAAAHALLGHHREVRELVRNLEPALVIAWSMRSALACLLPRVHGGPVIFSHNDFLPGPLLGKIVRAAARRADEVIAPSAACARELKRCGRVTVVHPGIDVDAFAATPPASDPPTVLVLGALVGWKRPDLALEIVARTRLPNLCLRLAGITLPGEPETLEAALRRRATAPDLAGAVEFCGEVPDVRAELEAASCLLHCAEREPFGIAVLEAMAAGRPVVVPAAGGPAEIVTEACGVLYPPGDADAAARGLVRVLGDPERLREMGAAARQRAREHFSRAAARERYRDVVAPLLRPPPAVGSSALEIVTVTHDSAPELRALLASVERHLPGTRVVVVDSGSGDGSLAVAREWQGSCEVVSVALGENVGFGRACNRGVAEVRGAAVALLNPDVELLDGSLAALAAEATRCRRLLAPVVVTPAGHRQDSVHPVPGRVAELLRAVVPYTRLPLRTLAPWRASRPRRVGWAVGCAVVAETALLRGLGPFDERIFLYGEDLELGLRAGQAGIPTWFQPGARVLHHGAHSTGRAFGAEAFDRLAETRHDAVARRCGRRRARIDDLAQTLTFASRVAARRLLGRDAGRERQQLASLRRARQ